MSNVTIQLKRGTQKIWRDLNPILAYGELGYEKETRQLKIGDGITPWLELPYQNEIDSNINYSIYFDIDYDGLVSLKDEYKNNGTKNTELPEVIIIPDVINNTAVTALEQEMFKENQRVKSITIPNAVTTIPLGFANKARRLIEIKGTENIEVIEQAAFQMTSIQKALFPKLKSFNGAGHFNSAVYLTIVDIGDEITSLPTGCFMSCQKLSLVKGGSKVTSIGEKGVAYTYNLLHLPFANNLKSIDKHGFTCSRIDFDWWNLDDCTFGEDATPAQSNKNDWWSDCTYTACENQLGSVFHQRNPEWMNINLPNSTDTYGTGCLEVATAHIYSALSGVELDSPRQFVEEIIGTIDNGRLLAPTGIETEGAAYSFEDMSNWLNAAGLYSEMLTNGWNKTNLQKAYDALANGALILTYVHPGHAAIFYGVNSRGEMMVLDSDSFERHLHIYEPVRFQARIQNLTIQGGGVVIVYKTNPENEGSGV